MLLWHHSMSTTEVKCTMNPSTNSRMALWTTFSVFCFRVLIANLLQLQLESLW